MKNNILSPSLLNTLNERYQLVRNHTGDICKNLQPEDLQLQASDFASPAKWHLAHTSWFFETFLLKPHQAGYKEFNPAYNFFFNSYYESVGKRNPRPNRGLMSRPLVSEIFSFRRYVDSQMALLLDTDKFKDPELMMLFELGLQHEQQHQELLITDIKYALSLNPLYPAVLDLKENKGNLVAESVHYSGESAYNKDSFHSGESAFNRNSSHSGDTGHTADLADSGDTAHTFIDITGGIFEIGARGEAFSFDNEHPRHRTFLESFSVRKGLVTNGEYLAFMNSGGYENFNYWHADARPWIADNEISAPLYWLNQDGKWFHYTLNGLSPLNLNAPVTHISFYEAFAFAEWAGMRLLTEQEWEVAAPELNWGERWEWTSSAYVPYPGYQHAAGALGEYNGKFMVNQIILRGASIATSPCHSRITYRNFFNPPLRWQFTGIRLAQKHGNITT